MVELREAKVLKPGDVDYARAQAGRLHWKGTNEAELGPRHKAAPLDDPEEGDDWVLRAKGDDVDETERRVARLAIQGAGGTDDDSLGHAAPPFTSIQVNKPSKLVRSTRRPHI